MLYCNMFWCLIFTIILLSTNLSVVINDSAPVWNDSHRPVVEFTVESGRYPEAFVLSDIISSLYNSTEDSLRDGIWSNESVPKINILKFSDHQVDKYYIFPPSENDDRNISCSWGLASICSVRVASTDSGIVSIIPKSQAESLRTSDKGPTIVICLIVMMTLIICGILYYLFFAKRLHSRPVIDVETNQTDTDCSILPQLEPGTKTLIFRTEPTNKKVTENVVTTRAS